MAKGFCESPREDLILLPFSGTTGTAGTIQNPVSIPSGYKPISVDIETNTYVANWCRIQLIYFSSSDYEFILMNWNDTNPIADATITGKILCAKV